MSVTALEGVMVLDLSTNVAGPYCTRLLAGLGADVVKVEPPAGDPARHLGLLLPAGPDGERSALFHHLNGAKKSIVFDVCSEGDRAAIRRLAARSQIVVESFPPGLMVELGLDYASLRGENPALVMVSLSNYGQDGPYRYYRATELTNLALGGLLCTAGNPGQAPLALPGFQPSYITGLHAAVAVLAALWSAERTGHGQYLDVSTIESVASVLEATTVAYERTGAIKGRQGNRHGHNHPMTVLPCKDGFIGAMIGADANWDLLVTLSGLEGLTDDRFSTADQRWANADEIDAIMRPWLMSRRRAQLWRSAQDFRIPFAMVRSPIEVLQDPQNRRRKFFSTIHHPVVGKVTVVGPPFRMTGTPWITGRAPLLDEHGADRRALLVEPDERCRPRSVEEWGDVAGHPADSAGSILGGVRIVDLTTMWAGPYCTRLLADLGAEVIKIESPRRVDGTRSDPGYFEWLNRNKLSVTLDLNHSTGKEIFRQLVRVSDVVVENFSPRVMPNFGLDYPSLQRTKPDLIMLSMPAYGATGPYRNHVAYGPGIEAMSGLSFLTGYEGGPPMLSGSAYGDPVAGLHGAVAVLAALRHHQHCGRGQWIDLSQRESLSSLLGEYFVLAGAGGEMPPRSGNRQPAMCPHGVYRCAGDDSWLAIAVTDDDEWRRLGRVIDPEALADDPRFRTVADRKAREDELDRVIESWTRQRDQRAAMRDLQAAGVAAGAVLDGRGLAGDEHLAARGFWVEVIDAAGVAHRYPGRPWMMAQRSGMPLQPAPRLGQHNRRIIGGLLGRSEADIGQLEIDGVIGYELQDDRV